MTYPGRRLGELFVELSDTMARDYDVADFLQVLVEGCCAVLAVDAAGVLLEKGGGRLGLSAASTEEMGLLEAFELQERTGPCWAAYQERRQVIVEDLADAEERWPTFTARAQELGLRSAFAFPLRLRGDTIGALNLFRHQTGGMSPGDAELAQALADVATIGILQQRAVADAELRAEELQGALDSRIVIEQAKGIVAERTGQTPAAAFERIRRHSMQANERLRTVCERIVAGELDLR